MNEQNKQPLTDDQLSALLRKWEVSAPHGLEARVFAARPEPFPPRRRRASWWRFLLRGSIRVPVPVACCVTLLMILVLWRSARPDATCSTANVPVVLAGSPAKTPAVLPANPVSITCPANSSC